MKHIKKEKYSKIERAYRKILTLFLICGILAIAGTGYYTYWSMIPSKMSIRIGSEEEIDLKVPASGQLYRQGMPVTTGEGNTFSNLYSEDKKNQSEIKEVSAQAVKSIHVDLRNPLTIKANQTQSYQMDLKLFGFLPLKSVSIDVIEDKQLIPAGVPIGIYVKTDGILVIGIGEFLNQSGYTTSPCKNILQPGDYIEGLNGKPVTKKADFMERLQEIAEEEIILTIRRGEESFPVRCHTEKNKSGEYKLGIWIRDNAQGVGTLTYIDESGNFGALGHGINDIDTSTLMQVESGNLYKTEIIGIRKGSQGTPGELTGIIDYAAENQIGSISQNTTKGIFGLAGTGLYDKIETKALPIGLKQEVKKGNAQILCSVNGQVETYQIEITDIYYDNTNVNRGIVLKIVDEKLLSMTGGIVQGMSGSPIIQNGKVIGAVTHVLVQDATKGYGIFIENMIGEGNGAKEGR